MSISQRQAIDPARLDSLLLGLAQDLDTSLHIRSLTRHVHIQLTLLHAPNADQKDGSRLERDDVEQRGNIHILLHPSLQDVTD